MAIHISRREVLNNLIRFKDNLLTRKKREIQQPASPRRVYVALLNRHTGDIRFAKEIDAFEQQLGSAPTRISGAADWQEIYLVAEDNKESVEFHLSGVQGDSFTPAGIDPVAAKILFETLDVLNELASLCRKVVETLPETAVFQHLSEVRVTSVEERIESMPGWAGAMSRIEAEKKLLGYPPGTFLLRCEEGILDSIAQAFSEANKMPVKLYVLTYIEEKGKISDHLILQTQWGWTICCDESDLASPVYQYHSGAGSLLRSFGDRIKTPV